ncbi:MAG: hypothetical protein HYU99_04065 [Deltaproteobacteria bacterium]|nr:hypothetical protein [Deltaproteobacteria bacterium]
MSKAVPELSQDEFIQQSTQILNEGVENHYSKEYVTDQLFHLAYENKTTAAGLGFPVDPPTIKQKVVKPWYGDRKATGPDPQPGPEEEFEIIIHDEGGRNGSLFGGTLTVRKNDGGPAVTVPASSWPDKKELNPGIKEGTYPSVYKINGHKNATVPGVQLNNNETVPTIGPNPVQNNKEFADKIHIHKGGSISRGSKGCQVIRAGSELEVWNKLSHGATGQVTVERE